MPLAQWVDFLHLFIWLIKKNWSYSAKFKMNVLCLIKLCKYCGCLLEKGGECAHFFHHLHSKASFLSKAYAYFQTGW